MRFHVGDRVRITSDHPSRGRVGRIEYLGEVCGYYLRMEDERFTKGETLSTWAETVEHLEVTHE